MTKPLVAKIYNPQNQDREQLIDSFVVRIKTFKRLFKEISSAEMKYPEQHYLILGKRGMGKTTLLLRLAYEVEKNRKLKKWLIPLVFNEEEYGIRKLYKFWIRVGELLENKNDAFLGLSEQIENMSAEFENDDDYEKAIFELISTSIQKEKKKIILFIDNVGDILSKFSDKEAHRLRKILQTSSDFRIFAASSKDIDAFHDYKHPFYEFFKAVRLEGLTQKETEAMMLKLAELYHQTERIEYIIENQKGRLEAMRRLTGGVIRTIVLLFEIFVDNKNGTAFTDLDAILDRVTPLYKHRTDDLSPQQQEILEAIAFAWDAVSVKEVKQKTRMESKVISAQIATLVKNHVIARIPTTTKNHFYQIDERFYNIWYLMRYGKKGQKDKVLWLIRFLEEWCDEKAIIERAKQQILSLGGGKYDERAAFFMAQAIAATKHLPQLDQDELLKKTKGYLKERESEYADYLSDSDIELVEKATEYFKKEKFDKSLACLKKMRKEDAFMMGYLYHFGIRDFINAEIFYKKAINNKESKVLKYYGFLLQQKREFEKAHKIYLDSIRRKDFSSLLFLINLSFFEIKFLNHFLTKEKEVYILKNEKKIMSKLKKFLDSNEMNFEMLNTDFFINNSCLTFIRFEQLNVLTFCSNPFNNDPYFDMIFNILNKEKQEIISIEGHEEIIIPVTFYTNQFTGVLKELIAINEYKIVESFLNIKLENGKEIRESRLPIYYTLMYYMQDEYPNEYLRMGSELKETVEEIIGEIEKMKKRNK